MPNENRLIDANAMRQEWLENGENEFVYDTNAMLDSIDAQPTVDAVEVVRCKDCKHFVTPQGVPCCDNFFGLGFPHPSGDDFCSYGERKEDGKE